MSEATRRTPIYERHAALGARFVPFAGYAMPVLYTSLIEEHRAVRSAAGLFDVSHMGEVWVRGPGALDALQRVVTNDLAKLRDGRAMYTVMCRPDGGIIDDLIVYRLAEDELLCCVNASRRDVDFPWIAEHVGDRAEVTDESEDWAQLALQGPRALAILASWLGDSALESMRPFRVQRREWEGAQLLVATTGYTGAGGCELYLPASHGARAWDAILATGAAEGLVPVGLGARDTLRLEMGYCLYGNDIDEATHPLEAGLGWVVKPGKGDFIGREAIERARSAGLERRLVGFELTERGIARAGYPIVHADTEVGRVTSGTRSPTLERSIGMGYVPVSLAQPDTPIAIEIRGRHVQARVRKPPFISG